MPITRTDRNQIFRNGQLIDEQVVQVDITAERTISAIESDFATLRAELSADRQAYINAINDVNTAKTEVQAHVNNIQTIAATSGSLNNANLSDAVRALADAMLDHFIASNRLLNSQIVLAQAIDKLRLGLHRLVKLVLVLLDESQRDSILSDDPNDPLEIS